MEITLPPELERALQEQAGRRGTTPEQLALDTLRRQFVDPPPAQVGQSQGERSAPVEGPNNLAGFLSDFLGVLHSHDLVSGGARLSESTAEAFAAALAEKRKQGRL